MDHIKSASESPETQGRRKLAQIGIRQDSVFHAGQNEHSFKSDMRTSVLFRNYLKQVPGLLFGWDVKNKRWIMYCTMKGPS
jgi:hypothetical protein